METKHTPVASKGRITLTPEFAMASGWDAANMRMRKAGRTKWNRADYNHGVETTARLLRHLGGHYPRIARDMLGR